MSIVSNIVSVYLPAKKKTTPSGWISFNAPCCHHNGHAHDTRGRGGLIINGDEGVTYHCFNCGFKCSWQAGRNLSLKFKNFLSWIGVPDNTINQLSLDLLKQLDNKKSNLQDIKLPTFKKIELPDEIICVNSSINVEKNLFPIIEYIADRGLNFNDTNFYWSKKLSYRDRLIIPFYYKNEIVGYTARTTKNKKPKYITNSQPGYVFGLDEQKENYKLTLVCEGPIDALLVGATSILGSEISAGQALLLNSLETEKIIIPDRDSAGKKLVNQAIDLGWSVSFPAWNKDINDIGDAVHKYGRMLTLYSIITAKETSNLKINLRAKKWFG